MFKLPVQIKNGIDEYAKAIDDFISGKMAWARFSGIRVPWGNYSHRGGKVFMARVRIPAGVLTPQQLKALAYCSKEYGNGILHITTRQDIQIHEVKVENIIKIHKYLKDYELSSRGGGGNTVRNIIACPLAGICPEEAFDVRPDAVALSEYLLSLQDSYTMPRKFKIAFSGCPSDCINARVNDLGLFATRKDSRPGYKVYVAGGMGAHSRVGQLLEEFIDRSELGYVVSAVKNVFYKHGDRRNKHHNRLRFLVEDIGLERFLEYYRKELTSLKKNEYIVLRKIDFSHPEPLNCEDIISVKNDEFKDFVNYNCIEQKQKGLITVKLRIPRGDLRAQDVERIASLEDEFKTIEFRTSPEQNLYVTNIPESKLFKFYEEIKKILDEFLYPSTLLDVVACKGSLTCNLGLCNSPGLAKEVEKVVKETFLKTKVFNKIKIKINGCPNACGQHPVGIISFHGVVRKVQARSVPFYKLLLGGRGGLAETCLAQDTGILIPAKNIPLFLREFLKAIDEEISEDTDIYKYIRENGKQLAEQISQEYLYVPGYEENRDFYIDWGDKKEFSLEGLGPGECGAGVLDMIESDLTDAEIALDEAKKKDFPPQLLRKALYLASRALLVVRGKEPKTEEEALSCFKEKFIDEGIASTDYSDIDDIYNSINEETGLKDKEEKFAYAQRFLEHIKSLYKSMDSSFNFPRQREKEKKEDKESIVESMDLKGTPCPLNYVKAKLKLETLNSGQILEILLDEGEPIENVPKSLEQDGHKILEIKKQDGYYKVIVKKL